jgi:hypothetical protein
MGNERTEKYFYEVKQIDSDISRYNKTDGILINYKFAASRTNTLYQRSIFNLFDALSRLGGVFAAMRSAGLMFTGIFSYRLMMSSLIGKLFHFRPRFKSEVKKVKKNKKSKQRKSLALPLKSNS